MGCALKPISCSNLKLLVFRKKEGLKWLRLNRYQAGDLWGYGSHRWSVATEKGSYFCSWITVSYSFLYSRGVRFMRVLNCRLKLESVWKPLS